MVGNPQFMRSRVTLLSQTRLGNDDLSGVELLHSYYLVFLDFLATLLLLDHLADQHREDVIQKRAIEKVRRTELALQQTITSP